MVKNITTYFVVSKLIAKLAVRLGKRGNEDARRQSIHLDDDTARPFAKPFIWTPKRYAL